MEIFDFKFLITTVFMSIFGVFGIYHFFSFLVLRHKILLYYFILIIGLSLHWSLSLFINGSYSKQVILIADKASLTTAMISTFGLLMFTKSYLNITKNSYPRLSAFYKVFTIIMVSLPALHILNYLFIGLEWLNNSLVMLAAIIALSTTLLSLFSGIHLYNALKFNKYYLYSYTPYLLGSIIYISAWFLKKFYNVNAEYIVLATSILVTLQLILFSILVSYKYKSIEEENIHIQVEANKKLITEVDRQTKNLQLAKKELEIKNEELEMVNKLKTKLFSLLTHDVRGPLNNVGAIMEMIEGEIAEGPLKKFTKKLKNDVYDRISMVNALLDWSYKQLDGVTVNKKICDLNIVFNSILKEFEWLSQEKNIEIQLKVACQKLYIDENMLKVILRNLTSNAIKFSKKGQKIILSSKQHTNFIELAVKDYGLGMKTDGQNFFKSGSQPIVREGTIGEKGTGFGLMITKDFVEMNGGELICESEIDKGTTFILRFSSLTNEQITH